MAVPTEASSTNASTVALADPFPVRPVLPSISGPITDGGGGTATTITVADGIDVTPATVCVAATCWPATRTGTAIVNVPSVATTPNATSTSSTNMWIVAPGTPVPRTSVLPAMSGGVTVGAGGRARTV